VVSTITRDSSERLDRPGPGGDRQAFLQQRLQPFLAHAVAPTRHRRAVEHQPMLEELFAAEELVIGVLDPALAQHLVGEIIGVLEDRQPRHQSRRQWRAARIIRVDRPKPPFQEPPIHRTPQRHQRMLEVDDLIEPRAKQILLSQSPVVPVAASAPSPKVSMASESQIKFARNPLPQTRFPANSIAPVCRF
jgi:hypothetical protein